MHNSARLVLRLGVLLTAALSVFILSSCDQSGPVVAPIEQPTTKQEVSSPLSIESSEQLQRFQQASSELPLGLTICTETLATLGQQFLDKVNSENLELVKIQWQGCMETYHAIRSLQGFTPQHQQALNEVHRNLGNKLEMPGYIDSVQGYPFSGIVNDASLPLEIENLREQHGLTDESDVSIGYDVIGFLLWGEQRYNPELEPRSENRFQKHTAWEDSRTDLPISEHPNNRRRRLLALTLQIALKDSKALEAAWAQNQLPSTEQDANRWINQQLQAFMDKVGQYPNNAQLSSYLLTWQELGVLPGMPKVESTTEETRSSDMNDMAILKAKISSTLQQLLKQG